MKKIIARIGSLIMLLATGLAAPLTKTAEDSVSGDYLGQPLPGATPEVFARGIVSKEDTNEHLAPSFSPDGNEVLWWANRWPDPGPSLSMMMRRENGRWSAPRPTPFNAIMPAFSPDGHRACFYAFTPGPALSQEGQSHLDIWVVEKLPPLLLEPRRQPRQIWRYLPQPPSGGRELDRTGQLGRAGQHAPAGGFPRRVVRWEIPVFLPVYAGAQKRCLLGRCRQHSGTSGCNQSAGKYQTKAPDGDGDWEQTRDRETQPELGRPGRRRAHGQAVELIRFLIIIVRAHFMLLAFLVLCFVSPPAQPMLKSRQGRPRIAHRFNGGSPAPQKSPAPEGRKNTRAHHPPGFFLTESR